MTVFDSDIVSDALAGVAAVRVRLEAVVRDSQAVTIVTAKEVIRGQLNTVRQAEAGRGKIELVRAYELFERSVKEIASFRILPYTVAAHTLFLAWRAAKIRVGTQDLRIVAIAFAHSATLVTRDARDYQQVPGLALDVWN